MSDLTFEQLPKAVSEIRAKLDTIEHLLLQIFNKADPARLYENEYVTIKQAAEILTLSIPSIYALVHRRAIPSYKQGKRLYFSRQELNAWISKGRRKTIEEIEQEARNSLAYRRRK
jgi:excisionase family DNA binding protein